MLSQKNGASHCDGGPIIEKLSKQIKSQSFFLFLFYFIVINLLFVMYNALSIIFIIYLI
jgi:hypothetical protein